MVPLFKTDWVHGTVHLRRERRELLRRVLRAHRLKFSPWLNTLIDAALPALVVAAADMERAGRRAVALVAAAESGVEPPRAKPPRAIRSARRRR